MNAKIQELIKFLEEEIKIYQKVLKLSKEKTDIITKDKRIELEELINVEEQLVSEVQLIEKNRQELSLNIYSELGIDSKTGKVQDIIDNIPSADGAILSQKRKEFLDLIQELKKVNDINSNLINNSLEFVNLRMKIMSGTQEMTGNEYKATGKSNEGINRTMFDIKL